MFFGDCYKSKNILKNNPDPKLKEVFISENQSPAMKDIMNECKILYEQKLISSYRFINEFILIKVNRGFHESTNIIYHMNDLDFLYEDDDIDFQYTK